MSTSSKQNRRAIDQTRADEHHAHYIKSAFGAACVQAKRRGWTWQFEGDMVVVDTGAHVIECSDRLDFAAFVQEARS